VALANPVAQVIQDVRHIAISSDVPSLWTESGANPWVYIAPLAIVISTIIIGVVYFKRRSPYLAEDA
jgi:ABC-2 type transport system permease protein